MQNKSKVVLSNTTSYIIAFKNTVFGIHLLCPEFKENMYRYLWTHCCRMTSWYVNTVLISINTPLALSLKKEKMMAVGKGKKPDEINQSETSLGLTHTRVLKSEI